MPEHRSIARAGSHFETFTIQYPDIATGIGDERFYAQRFCRYAHSAAAHTEHSRQKFMRQ